MEIQSLEIDLEAGTLKINGQDFKSKPVVVTLPGSDGWPLARLFNTELAAGIPGACAELLVTYTEPNSRP